jgi:o-succinylbenzoate---CoA ligase
MSSGLRVLVAGGEPAELVARLQQAWGRGELAAVVAPQEEALLRAALPGPEPWPAGGLSDLGSAVVLGSGGSSGGRRWCVQPLSRLQRAAEATGLWLEAIGLDRSRLELFNALPLHHVSGLMPVLRARAWGAPLRWLPPAWLRQPTLLAAEALPAPGREALLSLVPTQLQRLLDHPDGVAWLQRFSLIWVGGATLPPEQAQRARMAGLRLSPCYGSTETGALVAALPPERFLAGEGGCGQALPHAALRLRAGDGALQIRASSLAAGFLADGALVPLPLQRGWWSSGDAARLGPGGLQLLGRLDGAISSGAETVFPEQVRQRLLALSAAAGLPVRELLLLAEPDPLWGERLAALVRLEAGAEPAALERLAALAGGLPPQERPRRWLLCPELARNGLGKWERQRWIRELQRGGETTG